VARRDKRRTPPAHRRSRTGRGSEPSAGTLRSSSWRTFLCPQSRRLVSTLRDHLARVRNCRALYEPRSACAGGPHRPKGEVQREPIQSASQSRTREGEEYLRTLVNNHFYAV